MTWCLRCYEPVRQLTPRARQLPPLPSATEPAIEPERSRWKAGVNTFGPFGRVSITVVVLLFAPLSANPIAIFLLWPCYLALAFLVLRSVWKKDFVVSSPTPPRVGAAAGAPVPQPHREPAPRGTLLAWGALLVAGIALAIVWASSGHVGRASIGISASIATIVLWIRFATRS